MKMSAIRSLFSVLVAGAVLVGLWGCGGETRDLTGKPPVYPFSKARRVSTVSFTGILQASQSADISLREGVYGKIKWLEEEGRTVASGDHIASIDMEEYENHLLSQLTNQRHSLEQRESYDALTPLTMERFSQDFCLKNLDLALKLQEKHLLSDGKTFEERQRAMTDVEKTGAEVKVSKTMLEFQKNVTERGFDTPFSLKKRELEHLAKEVEREYAVRRLQKMNEGPMQEELARADFQVEVASGEKWLSENIWKSGIRNREIGRKSIQFGFELHSSQVRETEDRLKQREIRAPKPGMIVYPILWESKFSAGDQVWPGMIFLKVVGNANFLVDAAVDENISSLLAPGASATVFLDPFPQTPCRGWVTFVGKVPRRTGSRTRSDFKKFPIQVGVDTGTLSVRLGQKGTVFLDVAAGDGVFLPRDLIKGEGSSSSVSLLENGAFVDRAIKAEPFDADFMRWLDPPVETGLIRFPQEKVR